MCVMGTAEWGSSNRLCNSCQRLRRRPDLRERYGEVELILAHELDMTVDPRLIGRPASLQGILALSDFTVQEKLATLDVSTSA
ncbi:hypothetical protein AC792_08605 [Arthrobacter sp. RIT-PI-e]|nr:hypothetical protein AC792_08605 [Arthrobacter sp. RIT-PI-e]